MAYNNSIFTKGTTQYRDLDLSFKPEPFSGDLRTKTDVDAVQQSLMSLIYTNFGERPFRPSIGGNTHQLLFEPLDHIVEDDLKIGITTTITNFEPRVQVISLNIQELPDNNQLNITLTYQLVNVSDPQTFSIILKRVR